MTIEDAMKRIAELERRLAILEARQAAPWPAPHFVGTPVTHDPLPNPWIGPTCVYTPEVSPSQKFKITAAAGAPTYAWEN